MTITGSFCLDLRLSKRHYCPRAVKNPAILDNFLELIAYTLFVVGGFVAAITSTTWAAWVSLEFEHPSFFTFSLSEVLENWRQTGDLTIIGHWLAAYFVCMELSISVALIVPGFVAWHFHTLLQSRVAFENATNLLCGALLCGERAKVSVRPGRASVFLSGKYSEDLNVDEVAQRLALKGLKIFPKSKSFYVEVKDSKRESRASVDRE